VRPAQLKDIAKEFKFERATKQLTKQPPWRSLTEICLPGDWSWDAAAAAAAWRTGAPFAPAMHLEADVGFTQ
jgi:hypothetical protein